MGTAYMVKVVGDRVLETGVQERLQTAIQAALDDIDQRMSTYREDSELSRFNRYQGVTDFPLSDPTLEVLSAAIELGRLTDGALDVTVGPLVAAWGFGAEGEGAPTAPEPEVLAELRQKVGVDKLEVDLTAGTARKLHPALEIDLSSIAKGYAVDRVAEALIKEGFESYMVEVGGEVRAAGRNESGKTWRIGIEQPDMRARTVQRIIPLEGQALATSGDYRNYREVDGKRLSHILDPRTGKPVEHQLASVSVLADSCAEADALATALMVLGPEEGPALALIQNWAVLFLVRDDWQFVEMTTPAFEAVSASP